MVLLRKRTLPSPRATLQPLVWLLPMLMSLKLPPPLYLTVFMALVTFFIDVQSLSQAQPRGHPRSEPGDFSRPFQATSNNIRVLLVPSMMVVIVTAPGWDGLEPARAEW